MEILHHGQLIAPLVESIKKSAMNIKHCWISMILRLYSQRKEGTVSNILYPKWPRNHIQMGMLLVMVYIAMHRTQNNVLIITQWPGVIAMATCKSAHHDKLPETNKKRLFFTTRTGLNVTHAAIFTSCALSGSFVTSLSSALFYPHLVSPWVR